MRTSIPVQTAFGNHIRQLREQTRLTVEQLSEKSGFSSHRLRAIERGEINLNLGTMLILAMALDTTLHGGAMPVGRDRSRPRKFGRDHLTLLN